MFLGDDDQSARHPVEAMDDARPQQTRPGRLLVEVMLQCVTQRAGLQIAGRMRDLPGRLVDDDQPGVFVNDVDGQLLRAMNFVGRLDQADADRVPLVDPLGDFDRVAVELHLPGGDDPLQLPRRVIAEVPGEKRIDPHAAEVAFDDEFGSEGKRGHESIVASAAGSCDDRGCPRASGWSTGPVIPSSVESGSSAATGRIPARSFCSRRRLPAVRRSCCSRSSPR